MAESRVSIEKLNGINYASWSYQMKMVLMDAELWSVIEPGEDEPKENATAAVKKQYVLRQGRALAKIALAICDEQQMHIRNITTAREAWDELQKLYAPKDSKFRTVQLRRQLYSYKMNACESMEHYLGQINKTIGDLSSVGDTIEDEDLAMIILCGLSEDYDNVVTALCNLPTTDFTSVTIKMRLLAEDARRRNNGKESKETALLVKSEKKPIRKKQGIQQNFMRNRQESEYLKKSQLKGKIVCYRCQKIGHIARNCPNRISDKKDTGGEEKTCSMSVCCSLTKLESDSWIIDSGATQHMTPNKDYFSKIDKNDKENIILANGSTIPSLGKGAVNVKIKNTSTQFKGFKMEKTILAPELKHGIVSVTALTKNDKVVIFDKNGCTICDSKHKVLVKAKPQGGLYVVDAEPYKENALLNKLSEKKNHKKLIPLDVWHKRMMHVSKKKIMEMYFADSVKGLGVAAGDLTQCDSCLLGKSTRQPFLKNISKDNVRKTAILELIHSDLMGPIDVASLGGKRYIMSMVDEASRYVFVKFLKHKNEALDELKKWKIEVEKQTGKKLKRLRTDNGLEYCSNEWTNFCESEGIRHETTMVYTPQQNGVSERLNRTLLDLVRATLHATELPKNTWAELVYTAAYIRNRVTNAHNSKKTPYELWTGKRPSVKHFREIGCEVFVHIPKSKRHSKLTPRAEKGLLVGYAIHGRGYRIWNPETFEIKESRDCIFMEDKQKNILKKAYESTKICFGESKINNGTENGVEYLLEDTPSAVERNKSNVEVKEIPDTLEKRDRSKKNSSDTTKVIEKTHPMVLRSKKSLNVKDDDVLAHTNTIRNNDILEPKSFNEAISSIDVVHWLEAMNEEINSLRKHNVWELVDLPPGITPIKCKWVFKKKTNGETQRFKARLVARGFTQQKGVDYDEIYAPVSSFETIRLLVAAAVENNWFLDQFDVKTAYLQSDLKELLYMEQPEGFIQNGQEKLVCKLKKSIYGLKQSGRYWNEHLDVLLKKCGFIRNDIDPCVYKLKNSDGKAILTVYVDDIIALTENEIMRKKIKILLKDCFEIKYLGTISNMLGVKFTQGKDGSITLSQEDYVDHLMHQFHLNEAKGMKTPMETKPVFLSENTSTDKTYPYREIIGGLLYLAQRTRPDIAFAVGKLAQFCTNYNTNHWEAAKRIIRYLKETKHYGIVYRSTGKGLVAFADADWATCTIDRKSVSGYVLMLAGAPVLWRSNKQATVALSTMEAEYVSLADCARNVFWTRNLLQSLNFSNDEENPTIIWSDSQAAIAHAKSYINKSKTKHIGIKYHFIREKIIDKVIELKYIASNRNIADILTKSLNQKLHEEFRDKLIKIID